MRIADVWRKGTPPVAGGILDQPARLTDAVRRVWMDEDQHRAEAMGPIAALLG